LLSGLSYATVRMPIEAVGMDAIFLKGVSEGWPAILSGLKTLLEIGEPLLFDAA
jgi:hypothetical protein